MTKNQAFHAVLSVIILIGAASAASCGSGYGSGSTYAPGDASSDAGLGTPYVITIQNMMFAPANLVVPPGATVAVRNLDAVPHSVTSEATAGSFIPGSVNGVSFDTGVFTGRRTFDIPASAPPGTVVPYFCTVHRQAMMNSGQITIQ